ncbi:MAG: hypothetical protein ACTHN8_00275 [Angustibacter sp.]
MLLEGSDIDELLERVRSEHGPDARIVHAEQKLVGGVGGFFAKRRFEVAVAVDDVPGGPASIDDLLALADAQDGAAPREEPAAETPALQPDPVAATNPTENERQPGRQVSTETESFDHFVRELIAQAEGGPLHPEPAPFVPAALRVEPVPAPKSAPAPAAAAVPADDPRLALLDRLAQVAVTPPRALVGTHVVVGPQEPAVAVARAWLAECGEDDSALVGAGGVPAVDGRLVAAGRPSLVVLTTDGTTAGARGVARQLAAVGAGSVTAVVDARWDVTTTRRHLDVLRESGARLDALAAHGVRDCADPLSLLALDVPVTWLDARPATLGTWAAPCLDLL